MNVCILLYVIEIEDLEKKHAHRTLNQKIKSYKKFKLRYQNRGEMVDKNGKLLYEAEDMKRR